MWNKQQIQQLRQRAYSFSTDDYVREHLTALNIHLNNHEQLLLIQKKNEKWKEIETEADLISGRISQIEGKSGPDQDGRIG